MAEPAEGAPASNFIREIVEADLASNKHQGRVQTRFPPEPNGFLHIGHAKSICLNFGLARDFGGKCNLRFDDTNPTKEDVRYVEGIQEDVRWLGFDWEDRLFYASDYFEKLYEYALILIKDGKAYVDSLSEEEIRKYRGTVTEPGKPSPYRSRSVEENLDLFERMRKGEFPDGAHILRAKIDLASPNMKMRDPPIYRIRHATHHHTGDKWVIYPLYDYTHCISDALEGITHSICTLEFENNRELYDWFLDQLPVPCHPQQIEFARLNLSNTMMSKRKLLQLVENGTVMGWDDPRMMTIAGLRRRGFTPESLRAFAERVGVARRENMVEMALLEHTVRDDLNTKVARAMAVTRPLKLVIDSLPEGHEEEFEAPNFPDDPPKMGSRKIPFSREVWIERDDFMLDPPKKFFRLSPGNEVRLRWAYVVKCTDVVKDASGEVIEVHCTHDATSKGGTPADGRKIKGTIHWVSAKHAVDATVRLIEPLFTAVEPDAAGEDWTKTINPKSLEVIEGAKLERSLGEAAPGTRYQFERTGFFFLDPYDAKAGKRVWNRIVSLKDSWAKIASAKG